ncbi:hypothetical protein ACHAQJ_001207 [Trichoderma viride]
MRHLSRIDSSLYLWHWESFGLTYLLSLHFQSGIQRPLRPAAGPETTTAAQENIPSIRDLDHFSYSDVNEHNALGLFRRLESLETGSSSAPSKKYDNEIRLTASTLTKYLNYLRLLPSRAYVDTLTVVFFEEFGWQYSLIDQNIFADQLAAFYGASYDSAVNGQSLQPELFSFPSLLFQVLALALQFLPLSYERLLGDLCLGSSIDYLAEKFSATGVALSALLEKDRENLVSVQASFHRVCWLKNCGRVTESWHALGQAIMDAKEIGLHREDGKVEVDDAETACTRLWTIEMRRRVWLNLYLWDSEMSMVLGKPMNIDIRDCWMYPPIDAHIPRNRKTTVPFPRAESDKPTPFTQRLIEYRLQIHLPEIRELAAAGPYPREYATVRRLHQEAVDYINKLTAIYRFEDPNTSFDAECPWLVPQRQYLCSITWFFILALHKPYLFSIPDSRTEVLKAGINVLKAQQRNFQGLKVQHYKLFILTYLTLEAAVSILAVLVVYPADAGVYASEAFHCIKESLSRLHIIQENKNILAGGAIDVIQVLLNRAETTWIARSSGIENALLVASSSSTYEPIDEPTTTSSFSNEATSSFDGPETTFTQEKSPSSTSLAADSISPNPEFIFPPLQPVADLVYHDLAPAFHNRPSPIQETDQQTSRQTLGNIHPEDIQLQFAGDFPDNSFWSFINQGQR